MLVKENIKHCEEDNVENKKMQVTAMCIQTKLMDITIAAIYCPPRFKMEKEEYIHLFQKLGNCFIIGGDYNEKNTYWGSRLDTPKGKELYEAIKELNCEIQSTGKPTSGPPTVKRSQT